MQNSINTFNAAKMEGASDVVFQAKYNYLIDILQRQIKILQASIENGISVDSVGTVSLGLATVSTPGALSAGDWSTFNNKAEKTIWGALT